MVTILKLDNKDDNNEMIYTIYEEFIEAYNVSIFDRMLIEISPCRKYELLYLFMDQEELNTFINLILDYNFTIYSKEDYTDKLISMVVNNKIGDFKSKFMDVYGFDELIVYFYESTITKDNVLDKASFNGFDSLTENDYKILKS
jgi:hypothetical protein